ncbi:hypothetical protein P8C59_008344 [Phyllachora maydis]|uniref:Zinc transporter n=1 Tax=Phyllachora maydis TaxID=1825666 RepID=A0AAD9IAY3_9PEZI|nr:hypothetical protein P8C59_008344 [Phyllachora maydis]
MAPASSLAPAIVLPDKDEDEDEDDGGDGGDGDDSDDSDNNTNQTNKRHHHTDGDDPADDNKIRVTVLSDQGNDGAASVTTSVTTSSQLLRPTRPSFAFAMAPDDAVSDGGLPSPALGNPFQFETQVISSSAGPVKPNIGQRRGHRYKHSSISTQHQIFPELPPRPPPVLPASLPVPTPGEAWASMQPDQRARLYWCSCHAAVAVYVFLSAGGRLAVTALSHLVFFDVGSAAVCVAVDVLGNFEVWRRSSVRHPFGLQRAEVLAGFAMSVFLVFGGFDLLSHNLKHALEHVGPDQAPDAHADAPQRPGTVDTASLAAVVSTLVSAYGLRNHSRIRRVMARRGRPAAPLPRLPGVLDNPFHSLTLFFAFLLLALPLLSIPYARWLDRLLCAGMAVSMFVLGARLAVAQGLMLLMSYNSRGPAAAPSSVAARSRSTSKKHQEGPTSSSSSTTTTTWADRDGPVAAVVREIEAAEPLVARVDEAQFWQVHYGLGVATLKVCLVRGGCDDAALGALRARVARTVQNRLGEGYGQGGSLRWEVTVQTSTEGR